MSCYSELTKPKEKVMRNFWSEAQVITKTPLVSEVCMGEGSLFFFSPFFLLLK